MTLSFGSVTHSCKCDLCVIALNYVKASIPLSYAHCDRHKLFLLCMSFQCHVHTEGFSVETHTRKKSY
jgi:hypothetical protein